MRHYKNNHLKVELDEVFLDNQNSPGFSKENLEGVLEYPIERKVFWMVGCAFLLMAFILIARIFILQIDRGASYRARAEENHLRSVFIEPERGFIYDRTGEILAGNILARIENKNTELKEISNVASSSQFSLSRRYPEAGFLHVLGFLGKEGNSTKGINGLEFAYNETLRGFPGRRLEEIDALGKTVGQDVTILPRDGFGLLTSLSKDLQVILRDAILKTAYDYGFHGGAGIILDPRSGELLALVSVPDFDQNLLVSGISYDEFAKLVDNPGRPFFNRVLSGQYPPGSIVKPAVAIGALNENVIYPEKKILSTGSISLPNPYFPDKPSIFLDWKAHGWVDMRNALAVSSDVYFYAIGGGYQNQKGLGPETILKYFSMFGLGNYTGIDLPSEKSGFLPDPKNPKRDRGWSIGDTYHIAIGQGDILVTPIQMASYISALAMNGKLVTPHIGTAILDINKKIVKQLSFASRGSLMLPSEYFRVVREGMEQAVKIGTAQGLSSLPYQIAAKTGTAEIGKTGRVHSWSIGYFPVSDPKLAYVILMDDGPAHNLVGATYVASQMIQWIEDTHFLDTLRVPESAL